MELGPGRAWGRAEVLHRPFLWPWASQSSSPPQPQTPILQLGVRPVTGLPGCSLPPTSTPGILQGFWTRLPKCRMRSSLCLPTCPDMGQSWDSGSFILGGRHLHRISVGLGPQLPVNHPSLSLAHGFLLGRGAAVIKSDGVRDGHRAG
jgi:hypothetical protein